MYITDIFRIQDTYRYISLVSIDFIEVPTDVQLKLYLYKKIF